MWGRKAREIRRLNSVLANLRHLDHEKNEYLRHYQKLLDGRAPLPPPGNIWQIPTQGRRP